MDTHDLTLTSADTASRVYIGPDMRIYTAGAPTYGAQAFRVQTVVTDRLGERTWQDATAQPTRRQVQELANALISPSLGSVLRYDRRTARLPGWHLLAGPFTGYRVLVRDAGRLATLLGRPYEFVVEVDVGRGSIQRWVDAEPDPLPLARLAFLIKRQLGIGLPT